VIAHADELFAGGVESIDPEVRSLVIGAAVKQSNDTKVIESLVELYRTTSSADLRDDICAGLTSVKQLEQIAYLLQQFTDSKTIRQQDLAHWFVYLIRNRYARTDTWQWMINNWSWIEQTFDGDKSYDSFPRYAAGALSTPEQLQSYRDFFTPEQSEPALTRTIELGIKEIEGRLELLKRDGDAVRAALLSL
jgi:aminopeptidase N